MSLTARRATMARKRYKAEEIVAKLRQVDVLTSQGQSMADAIRQIGVSEVSYYTIIGDWLRAEVQYLASIAAGLDSWAGPAGHAVTGKGFCRKSDRPETKP